MHSLTKYRKWSIMLVVFLAILLDYLLLTVIEPIAPVFLMEIENATEIGSASSGDNFVQLGLLYAAKTFAQFVASPLVGWSIGVLGYAIPLFAGFVIMIVSTATLAFANSFLLMLLPRIIQGVGAACVATSGFGIAAELYKDEKTRGKAVGILMAAISIGLMAGAPFGGTVYHFLGEKYGVFFTLSGLGILGAAIQLFVLPPIKSNVIEQKINSNYWKLLRKPEVFAGAALRLAAHTSCSCLVPALILWMIDKWNSTPLELGLLFTPSCILLTVGSQVSGLITRKLGSRLCLLLIIPLIGISVGTISFMPSQIMLVIPIGLIGFCLSFVEVVVMVSMAEIADRKNLTDYGNAYAIADAAMCMAYFTGPVISGFGGKYLGLRVLTLAVGVLITSTTCLVPILTRKHRVVANK